jgi:hypothetical protein
MKGVLFVGQKPVTQSMATRLLIEEEKRCKQASQFRAEGHQYLVFTDYPDA